MNLKAPVEFPRKKYLKNIYLKKFKFLLFVGEKTNFLIFKHKKNTAAILNQSMNLIAPVESLRKVSNYIRKSLNSYSRRTK